MTILMSISQGKDATAYFVQERSELRENNGFLIRGGKLD
jgi:ribosomal protein S12